ncbi:MAG: DUF5662 family protein [Bacilli bacterium]|nr:DUF5662 family protein [Bacilli bacterium]
MGIYSNKISKVTLDTKIKEYTEYIKEHKQNVIKCFDTYINIIQVVLDCDIDKVKHNVEIHDDSKFSNEEFEYYRQFFYPLDGEKKDKNIMNYGWLNHIHLNKHHWNYWVIVDGEGITVLDMPVEYIAEMILDWLAMSMKFNNSVKDFYNNNVDKMTLSPNTKILIDRIIGQF